ncbi:hypothetical protein DRJ25_03260 [Candidatus Woesearchaeota archaeon]|nr:MAG: hypothetical protein DRJ25_03260 [Candidatus Woesearchaeota archaeon]
MFRTTIIRNKLTGLEIKEATEYRVTWRQKGFDALIIYTMVYEWLCDNGWHDRSDENFPEIAYIERDFGAGGKEIWAYWRLARDVKGAPKDFVTQHLDIDFHFLNLKPYEMVYKGKKIKSQKGEFEIGVTAYLTFNSKKYWSDTPIIKAFQKIMTKRVLKRKKEKWRDELKEDAQRLREMVNIYLKIPHYYPEKEVGEFWLKRTGE